MDWNEIEIDMKLIAPSRPRFWLYLAGPAIVGAIYGSDTIVEWIELKIILLILYFLIPANFLLYGINDIYDAKIDKLNPKKKIKENQYEGDFILPVAIVLSFIIGLILMSVLPQKIIPWMSGFLFLSLAYSAPPFRFKTKPGIDSISNILYIFPGIITYIAVSGESPPIAAIVGGGLWAMAMHTFSAIPDISPDRKGGIETLATVLGEKKTTIYCGFCWVFSSILFAFLDIRLGMIMLVYPVILGVLIVQKIEIKVAYWWYPWINAIMGCAMVLGGLWKIV